LEVLYQGRRNGNLSPNNVLLANVDEYKRLRNYYCSNILTDKNYNRGVNNLESNNHEGSIKAFSELYNNNQDNYSVRSLHERLLNPNIKNDEMFSYNYVPMLSSDMELNNKDINISDINDLKSTKSGMLSNFNNFYSSSNSNIEKFSLFHNLNNQLTDFDVGSIHSKRKNDELEKDVFKDFTFTHNCDYNDFFKNKSETYVDIDIEDLEKKYSSQERIE